MSCIQFQLPSKMTSEPDHTHPDRRPSFSLSHIGKKKQSKMVAHTTDSGHLGLKDSLHSFESATTRLNREHIFSGHDRSFEDACKEIEGPADTFLVYSKQEEVRTTQYQEAKYEDGRYCIEDILNDAIILLNVRETNLQKIINYVLGRLLQHEPEAVFAQAVEEMFFPSTVSTLSRVIQGMQYTELGGYDRNQSWICAFAHLPGLETTRVAFVRLIGVANLGRTSQEVQFINIVLGPDRVDPAAGTSTKKYNFEVAQAVSTIFTRMTVRDSLLQCKTDDAYRAELISVVHDMGAQEKMSEGSGMEERRLKLRDTWWPIGYYMWQDLKRRVPNWTSDFTDSFKDLKSMAKVVSTMLFLYFACLLPSIAFGVLNSTNTGDAIGVRDVIFAQTLAGITYSLIGGQPMVILLTTAPIAIYMKTIYNIADGFGDTKYFLPMFAWTGLWNAMFLVAYSILGLSRFMRYSTRSTEEIFAIFVSIAFVYDAVKHVVQDFSINYVCSESINQSIVSKNVTVSPNQDNCHMEVSLLYLILCLSTVLLAVYMYKFKRTPFLSPGKRELVSDYSLPGACILVSFFGSYLFQDVDMAPFHHESSRQLFTVIPFWNLPGELVMACMALGFSLSLLFFMDQNIASAMVNAPANKLVKGHAYNWDLFVVALINAVFSVFGLPWVHGALPHSPLHVKALADMQERVDLNHVTQIIVKVRETRIPSLFAHIFIGCSILLLPYPLTYIPRPVLDGLFIALGITSLMGNQLFERICLIFVERTAYPPNHYIRICPRQMLHRFTVLQVIQLAVLCVFGFSPISYMKMAFPVFIMLLIPIRYKLIPKIIENKYLDCLDHHL